MSSLFKNTAAQLKQTHTCTHTWHLPVSVPDLKPEHFLICDTTPKWSYFIDKVLQTVVYAVKHLQKNDGLCNNGFVLLRALQFDLTLL